MIERKFTAYIHFPDSGELSSLSLSNQPAPSVDDWFKRELVRIGGRDRFGDPVFRLVWGQKELITQLGQVRMKYKAQTRATSETDFYDIGLPRFIIEEKYDSRYLLPGWNEAMQGAKPIRGQYRYLIAIQDEMGYFEQPNQSFISALERARFRRERDPLNYALDEEKPEHVRQREIQAMKDADQAIADKRRAEVKDMINSHYKSRIRRITHLHPNEGHVPDPYTLSKKAKEQGEVTT